MQLLTAAPKDADQLGIVYARTPVEGMVHSGLMQRERFEIASAFDESLSCASISWAVGGEEDYRLLDGDAITLHSAGALTLARGARYAYAAHGEAPFRSNMISFPHWITDGAAAALIDSGDARTGRRLETRLMRPDAATQSLMDAIAARCRADFAGNDWYAEKSALLYAALLDAQDARTAAREQIIAVKASTRAELARRAARAKHCILQRFGEATLSLDEIAREACLSPYHLIRVFRQIAGATPMQFLTGVRMDAAHRLLAETKLSIGEITLRTGYSDRSAFFKAFRKRFGVAPSAVERTFR